MFENQLLLEASLEPCWLGQLQKLTAQGRNGEMVTAQGVQKPEKLLWDGLLLAATRLSFSYVCVWMNRCSRWYCIGTCMICICRAYYVRYGLQNAKQANSWLEVIHKQAWGYIYICLRMCYLHLDPGQFELSTARDCVRTATGTWLGKRPMAPWVRFAGAILVEAEGYPKWHRRLVSFSIEGWQTNGWRAFLKQQKQLCCCFCKWDS